MKRSTLARWSLCSSSDSLLAWKGVLFPSKPFGPFGFFSSAARFPTFISANKIKTVLMFISELNPSTDAQRACNPSLRWWSFTSLVMNIYHQMLVRLITNFSDAERRSDTFPAAYCIGSSSLKKGRGVVWKFMKSVSWRAPTAPSQLLFKDAHTLLRQTEQRRLLWRNTIWCIDGSLEKEAASTSWGRAIFTLLLFAPGRRLELFNEWEGGMLSGRVVDC